MCVFMFLFFFVFLVGVSARFTEISHSISENENIQRVCAELIGLIQTTISVTLATQDGSATS